MAIRNLLRGFTVLLLILLSLAIFPFTAFSAPKQPIKWSISSFSRTMNQGEKYTARIDLTVIKKLQNVRFQLTPNLSRFIKISPKNFKQIGKNASRLISFKIIVPKNIKPGTYQGSLVLKASKQYHLRPLSIRLKILRKVLFKPKKNHKIAMATIGVTGGIIEAKVGPLFFRGIKVEFPAGALPATTTVSLGYDSGKMTPNAGQYAGFALALNTGDIHEFDQPITITAPLKNIKKIPVPYYIDPSGNLRPAQLISINTIAKTFSFQTFHASWYTWILDLISSTAYAPGTSDIVDTGFSPGRDGFQTKNKETFYDQKGECFGMTSFSLWYFLNARFSKGDFYPKYYDVLGTDFYQGPIRGQDVIATRAFTSISQLWDTYYNNIVEQEKSLSQVARYVNMRNSIKNTGKPVLIYLKGNPGAHSVLAYGYNDLAGTFSIYDPNYPGASNTINFNKRKKTFNPYDGFDLITYNGDGLLHVTESYQNILNDAEANFQGSNTAQISIESPANGEQVYDRTIHVRGKVKSAQVLVNKLIIFVGSTQFAANVGEDGSFDIPINLESGVNHLVFGTKGNRMEGNSVNSIFVHNNMDTTDFTIKENLPPAAMLVTLTWDTNDSDVDLYVTDPTGDSSWYSHKNTVDGGQLDYDVTGGYGPEHWTLLPTNTVRYNQPYKVRLHYFSDHGHGPTNYTVSIKLYEGTGREQEYWYRGNLAVSNSSNYSPGSTGSDWADLANIVLQP